MDDGDFCLRVCYHEVVIMRVELLGMKFALAELCQVTGRRRNGATPARMEPVPTVLLVFKEGM